MGDVLPEPDIPGPCGVSGSGAHRDENGSGALSHASPHGEDDQSLHRTRMIVFVKLLVVGPLDPLSCPGYFTSRPTTARPASAFVPQ